LTDFRLLVRQDKRREPHIIPRRSQGDAMVVLRFKVYVVNWFDCHSRFKSYLMS